MGQGLSKPDHMSDEEYEEYKFTSAEAREDLCGWDYSQYDEPDYDESDYQEVDE